MMDARSNQNNCNSSRLGARFRVVGFHVDSVLRCYSIRLTACLTVNCSILRFFLLRFCSWRVCRGLWTVADWCEELHWKIKCCNNVHFQFMKVERMAECSLALGLEVCGWVVCCWLFLQMTWNQNRFEQELHHRKCTHLLFLRFKFGLVRSVSVKRSSCVIWRRDRLARIAHRRTGKSPEHGWRHPWH